MEEVVCVRRSLGFLIVRGSSFFYFFIFVMFSVFFLCVFFVFMSLKLVICGERDFGRMVAEGVKKLLSFV